MKKYNKKLDAFVNYFRKGETDKRDFRIGMEMEHLIVERDNYRAVSYPGENGIEGILVSLANKGWEPVYEGNNLLGLRGDRADISLEPGGQLELSVYPVASLGEIDNIYSNFLQQLLPILDRKNKVILSLGYQPFSSIKDISLLPKKRYHYMYKYFKKRGKYAHHMMKGTASLQINIDYFNECDFVKKMAVSYYLSPLIYCLFDNAPFFEGKLSPQKSVRSLIWDNCDRDRCGIIDGIFDKTFSYRDYADYILNIPVICMEKDNELFYLPDTLIKDIFIPDKFNENEIAHFLTIVFPDIRLKQYIEIRMGDALPYPYNLGYLALWQGLLYNQKNLDTLYQEARKNTDNDILILKKDIIENGIFIKKYGTVTPVEKMIQLINMAKKGLNNNDIYYLNLYSKIVKDKITPKMKTISLLNQGYSKKKALFWCVINRGDIHEKCI